MLSNMHTRSISSLALASLLALLPWLASACGRAQAASDAQLRLATTTSTRDSGLLDELLPLFEERHDCRVDLIAVGSGAALRLGAAGDVDALLVHAPAGERAFIDDGKAGRHEGFMENEFVLVGPPGDPAGLRGLSIEAALRALGRSGASFLSRGDDSGTHRRELALWEASGGLEPWDDYVEVGRGMGAALVMADELAAYTLVDSSTWLRMAPTLELEALVAGGAALANPYSVLSVRVEERTPEVAPLADALVEFLISSEAQACIGAYRIAEQRAFRPTRL